MDLNMALNGNPISGYNQEYYSMIIESQFKQSRPSYIALINSRLKTCLFKENPYNPLCRRIEKW